MIIETFDFSGKIDYITEFMKKLHKINELDYRISVYYEVDYFKHTVTVCCTKGTLENCIVPLYLQLLNKR